MITNIHVVTTENFIVIDNSNFDADVDAEENVNENAVIQKIREKCDFDEKKNDLVTFVEMIDHEMTKQKEQNKIIKTSTAFSFQFETETSTILHDTSFIFQSFRFFSSASMKRKILESLEASKKKSKMSNAQSMKIFNDNFVNYMTIYRDDLKTKKQMISWQKRVITILKQRFKEMLSMKDKLHIYDTFTIESSARIFVLLNEDEQQTWIDKRCKKRSVSWKASQLQFWITYNVQYVWESNTSYCGKNEDN